MSKIADLRNAFREIQEYVSGRTPQPGVFSTLDEAIRTAPFERASYDQWTKYLQPGRMVKREGVQFPLKKEEIDYSLGRLTQHSPDTPFTKDELRSLARSQRPDFGLDYGIERFDDKYDPDTGKPVDRAVRVEREYDLSPLEETDEIHHPFGGVEPVSRSRVNQMRMPQYGMNYGGGGERLFHRPEKGSYEESVTRMLGLESDSHFTEDTLSWARVSRHENAPVGKVRLVEEIQSDHHQRAREPAFYDTIENKQISSWHYNQMSPERRKSVEVSKRGYLPKDDAEIADLQGKIEELKRRYEELDDIDRIPGDAATAEQDTVEELGRRLEGRLNFLTSAEADAPFKNPKDYAGLELRKQLYDAASDGDDYLALSRGRDQIERYSLGESSAAGTKKIYDELYLSELKKLARRYGARVTDVEITVPSARDARPDELRGIDAEDFDDYVGEIHADLDERTMEELTDIPGHLEELLTDVYNKVESTNWNRQRANDARQALNDLSDLVDDARSRFGDTTFTTGMKKEDLDELLKNVDNVLHIYAQNANLLLREASRGFENVAKDFPAIELTPEIREKILKTGVPMFARGGLVRAGKGGKISDLVEAVKKMARDPDEEKLASRLKRLERMQADFPGLELEFVDTPPGPAVQARMGDDLIGTLMLSVEDELAYPGFAHVREDFRGKGVGTAMYMEAARRLRELEKRLHMSSVQSDEAKALWDKLPKKEGPTPPFVGRSKLDDPGPFYVDFARGGKVDNIIRLKEMFEKLQRENKRRRDDPFDPANIRAVSTEYLPPSPEFQKWYDQNVKPIRPGAGSRVNLLPFEDEPAQSGVVHSMDDEMALVELDPEFRDGPDDDGLRDVPLEQIEGSGRPPSAEPNLSPEEMFRKSLGPEDPEELAEGGMIDPYMSSREEFEARESREPSLEDLIAKMEYLRETGRHYLSGLKSQWMTLNPETGRAELSVPPWMNLGPVLAGEAQQQAFRPGIIDETLAIPALIGESAPETSKEAMARAEALRTDVRRQMGLKEPRGALQHFADAAGMMTGQVPVPTSFFRSLVPKLGKIPGSAVEFLSPVVEPSAKSYTAGTAFGGTLGTFLGNDEEEDEEKISFEDLTPEEQLQLLEYLEREGLLEEEEGLAKGGKVSGLMSLREKLREALAGEDEKIEEILGGKRVTRRDVLGGIGALGATALAGGKAAQRTKTADELINTTNVPNESLGPIDFDRALGKIEAARREIVPTEYDKTLANQMFDIVADIWKNNKEFVRRKMIEAADKEIDRIVKTGDEVQIGGVHEVDFFDPLTQAPRGGADYEDFMGEHGSLGEDVALNDVWMDVLEETDAEKYAPIITEFKRVREEGL